MPDPKIEHPRDAIIKVTSCAICGSDLHLYDHFMPGMESGRHHGPRDHGRSGRGRAGTTGKLKVGDRVVIPFTIICGECEQCKRGNFSVCERTNRNKELADKAFGHTTAGLFGYTHLTGGYPGGQAEYLRVPFADTTHIKVPDGIPDEKLLFLSDIFPTGWQAAVQCDIQPTDTVAIWGCGPVGQMAIRSAILLGAKQVIAIDNVPERLAWPGRRRDHHQLRRRERHRAAQRTDAAARVRRSASMPSAWKRMPPARSIHMVDRAKQAVMLETDRPHVLREMIYVCRPAGVLSVPGVYGGLLDKIPIGAADEQGPDHPHRPDPRQPLDRTTCCAGSRRARSIRPSSSPTRSISPRGPRCTRRSATSRTAASRSCSSRTEVAPWLKHEMSRRGGPRPAPTRENDPMPPIPSRRASGCSASRSAPWSCSERRPLARWLGVEKHEGLIQAYGVREIATGIGILTSRDPTPWIWARVGGDALDIATLAVAVADDSTEQDRVAIALGAVAGATVLDVLCAKALTDEATKDRSRLTRRIDYRDRSGYPRAPAAMRGVAGDFEVPPDFRIPEALRPYKTQGSVTTPAGSR